MQLPEIKISVKYKKGKKIQTEKLTSSGAVAQVLRKIFDADTIEWKEEFILLCLNRANELIGYFKVSSGGMAGTIADPKIIYTTALNCTAANIIVAHNHPSGNKKPSGADISITRKLYEAGQLLDINLLDHIILTRDGYYSFNDEGEIC